MKRLRVASLAMGLLLSGAVVFVAQSGYADERRARSVAESVEAPAGAVRSDSCNGDGIRACWTTGGSVTATSDALTAALQQAADGDTPTRTCDRVPVGTTGAPLQADACFVRIRFGEHGAFVFIDPLTERDAKGVAKIVGSRILVQSA